MSERSDSGQQRSGLRRQTGHTYPRRRSPVLWYLVILFAAAFLLLLLAYFQQQRANQASSEAIDALRQSVSAADSIQILMEDNEELRARLEELEQQVATLESGNEELRSDYARASADRDSARNTLAVYQDFFRLDRLYRAQRFSDVSELIRAQEASDRPFSQYLSDTPVSDDPGETTPLARYRQICKQLLEWNYLKTGDVPNF